MKSKINISIQLLSLLFFGFINLLPAQNPDIALNLSINYKQSDTIYHDEPVLLEVSLSNESIYSNTGWNEEANYYLDELKKQFDEGKMEEEDYLKEKEIVENGMRPIKSVTIGSESKPWAGLVQFEVWDSITEQVIAHPIRLLSSIQTDPIAVLDENGNYYADFGISPEANARLTAGNYRITAKIDSIESYPARLVIHGENLPDSLRFAPQTLLEFGNYYLLDENPSQAHHYAGLLLESYPDSMDGFILRAEAYLLEKAHQKALADFRKALEIFNLSFPDAYEAPTYLLNMIDWLERKIKD